MKMEIKGDTSIVKWLVTLTAISVVALFVTGVRQNTYRQSAYIALALVALVTLPVLLIKREKLIVDGDSLCYISIRKKKYNVSDVKKIYIVNTQVKIFKGTLDTLYDKYVMIYLKNTEFKWDGKQGNIEIQMENMKNILFTTEYDERAVAYFRSKGIPVAGKIS